MQKIKERGSKKLPDKLELLQHVFVEIAHRNDAFVAKYKEVVGKLDLCDVRAVDDVIAVRSVKALRVERFENACKGDLYDELIVGSVNGAVTFFDFDVHNVGQLHFF